MIDNAISLKLERFYTEMTAVLSNEYQVYHYKNVLLSEIAIKFFLNQYINSTTLINEIGTVETNQEWEKLLQKYVLKFKIKISFFQKLKFTAYDLIRYLSYFFKVKLQFSEADYYFFITNKKFINYTKGIRKCLENKGVKSGLLIWENGNPDDEIKSISNTPKVAFPHFWKKNYFQYRNYNHLVDRVLGYNSLFGAKKIILIEGCVLSEHIVGEVCKSLSIETVCLQWGFFAKTVTQSGWREMPFDKFLVWGDFYKKNFGEYNSLPIVAMGHPNLNHSANYTKNKVVLFAVQKVMGDHITHSDIMNFIDYAINFAKKNPEFKVIIRSHPDFKIPEDRKEVSKELKNILWHDYYKYTLSQSFEEAKYCVSISSTVSLESITFNCYPIFVKANELPLQLHEIFKENNGFNHVFDYNSFENELLKLENKQLIEYIATLKKEIYKSLGSEAIGNIVNEIVKTTQYK